MLLMKIDRESILKPLLSVSGIVERRHTLPILSNVLIEKKGSTLSLSATDLEIQVSASAGVEIDSADFAITVSARKLLDIYRALPEGVEVAWDRQDGKVQLKAGKSRFNLQTLPADDYPRLAIAAESADEIRMPQKTLRELLGKVQFAMAQQDIRYYLNGLLLSTDGQILRVVATDGHRLSLAGTDTGSAMNNREVILPRKTVIELTKLLSENDEEVVIRIGQNQVQFEFGGISIITKIVDGKFPDYNRVVPVGHGKHIELDRMTLLQALQRAAILSNEKFRGVRLLLTQNSLSILCTNSEQEEAQEELEISYAGDPLDIGFNVNYLVDVLTHVSAPVVRCSFNDANSSGLFTLPGEENFKYVVMPMRI
jgi:DNA polymerase-3 subunit beta